MKSANLEALTGLRFFAAAMIVWLHLFGFGIITMPDYPLGIGVSLFFILSGFILAHNYQDISLNNSRAFILARIAKIFPLHIATLLIVLLLIPTTSSPGSTTKHYGVLLTNASLFQAWVPNTDVIFSFNGPSWSLSNELFFYFCFPLIMIARRFVIGMFLVWIGLLATFIVSAGIQPDLMTSMAWRNVLQFNPFFRIGEFIAGIIVYEYMYKTAKYAHLKPATVSALQIGAVAFFVFGIRYLLPVLKDGIAGSQLLEGESGELLYLWLVLTGAVFPSALLIFSLSLHNGVFGWVISQQPFKLLGEISFATYMIHQIVLRYFVSLGLWSESTPTLITISYLAATYIGSYVLWKYVEIPMQRRIRGLPREKAEKRFALPNGVPGAAPYMALVAMGIYLFSTYSHQASTMARNDLYTYDNGMTVTLKSISECEQGMCITLEWRGGNICNHQLQRVLHVVNTAGKLAGELNHNLGDEDDGACANDVYVDRIIIEKSKLKHASYLRLGLKESVKRFVNVGRDGEKYKKWIVLPKN